MTFASRLAASFTLLLLSSIPLSSCASSDKRAQSADAPPATPADKLATLRDELLSRWLQERPSWARLAGLHEYDGKVGAYAPEALNARLARLQKAVVDLDAIDAKALGADDALDLALLKTMAAQGAFELADLERHKRDPRFYQELFEVDGYLTADYAPLEQRVKSLLAHEEAALAQVAAIRTNLAPVLSKPIAETAADIYKGYAEYLRGDVVTLTAGVGDEAFKAKLKTVNEALAVEADKLSAELREKAKAGDASHVLGPEKYAKLLLVQEGLTLPLEEFKKMGEDNLKKNKAAYEALRKKVKPKRGKAKDLIADATKLVEESRAFIVANKIATLPSEDTAVVKESPPFMRWNQAFLFASGPFDPHKSAFYYITLPDAKWPKKEQEEYVPTKGVLLATTVHEVYPGHFLQGRFMERAPTRVQKLGDSYSFVEGWAHYTEEMMVDEGFRKEDPETRLGMLSDALLRNCRFVVSIGVHTEGMTLDQAEKRFMKDCFQDKASARQQAARATFDPGYFAYTLGKLQIMALRDEAKAALGDKFSLQAFHDRVLSHGAAPISLLRERVLGELGVTPAFAAPVAVPTAAATTPEAAPAATPATTPATPATPTTSPPPPAQ